MTCAEYLQAVRTLMHRRATLEHALEQALPTTPFAQTAYRLRCFKGIDTLTAMGLCAEIGDWGRFAKPSQLSAYLEIVPAEYKTDSKRRLGAITTAGSSHARRLLVEAAWHYRRTPRVGEVLERRQRGIDPRVVDVAWRCQQAPLRPPPHPPTTTPQAARRRQHRLRPRAGARSLGAVTLP